MQYFILKTTANPAVVGAIPQLHDFQSERDYDRNYSRIYKEFLSDDLCMTDFKMQDEAIKTDFLSASYLGLNGFFVSERLREILAEFLIPNSKFFAGTFYHRGKACPLYFLQILELEDFDFGDSVYVVKGAQTEEFRAESLAALRIKQSELNRAPRRPRLVPKRIKMRVCPDLMKVPLSSDFLISERLSERLDKESVTGHRLKKIREYEIL